MKRIISIVMALMMLLSTLTVAVSAQGNSDESNVALQATAAADFYNIHSKSYPLYINDGKIASTFGTAWDSWCMDGNLTYPLDVTLTWDQYYDLSDMRIMWWMDNVGVTAPSAAKLYYLDQDEETWIPVDCNIGVSASTDNTIWNDVQFESIRTTALKLEVDRSGSGQNGVGIGEWEVFGTPVNDILVDVNITGSKYIDKDEQQIYTAEYIPAELTGEKTFSWSIPEDSSDIIEIVGPNDQQTVTVQAKTLDTSATIAVDVTHEGITKSATYKIRTGKPVAKILYDFEDASGSVIPNIAEEGNDATMFGTGATIGEGKSGKGLVLNSSQTDGYVKLPAGILSGIEDFTVSSWVKVSEFVSYARVFDFGIDSNINMYFTPSISNSAEGNMQYAITKGSTAGEQKISIPSTFVEDQWVHLAIAQNGTTVTIFIDGIPVATNDSFTYNPANTIVNDTMNYIGKSQYSQDRNFKGSIDDFRLYDYALDQMDILDVMAESEGKISSVSDISLTAPLGEQPELPDKVDVTYEDGSTGKASVAWDDVTDEMLFSDTTYTVNGYLGGTELKVKATITVTSDSLVPELGIKLYGENHWDELANLTNTYTVTNYSDESQDVILVCALFNEEGILEAKSENPETIEANGYIKKSYNYTIPENLDPETTTVKLFVCNSSNEPISTVFEYIPEPIKKGSMIEDELVLLEEGMFKTMQDDNEVFLLQLDIDKLTSSHYKAAGLTPKAPQYGGWESWDSCGFGIGHFLSAACLMYKKTGNEEYKEKIDYAVSEIGITQRPSGFIGGIDEQRFIDNVFDKPDSFDVNSTHLGGIWDAWYGIQKVFKGLIEAYTMTGNEQALQIAIDFAEWAKIQTDKLNYEQMQRMLICEHGGVSESLLWLYNITNDEDHLDLARRFLRADLLDPLSEGIDNLTGRHVNETIPEIQNAATYYEYTGDEKYKDAAEFFWDTVRENRMYANSGIGRSEHFPEIDEEPLVFNGPETCCTFNFLKLTETLYSWDHDVKYIDYIEEALFNSIYPSQDPDNHEGYGKVYYTPFTTGGWQTYSTRDDAFWCCVLGGMENPARLSKMIYYKEKDNLYVNLFMPSTVTWSETGMVLTQEINFPYESGTKLIVKEGADNVGIKIRVPGWANGPLTIKVNGQEIVEEPVDGYITITRDWAANDEITVNFSMGLSLYTAKGEGNKVAFKYGPILLASSLGLADPEKRYSTDALTWMNEPQLQIPTLITDSSNPEDFMSLVDAETLTFRTDAIASDGSSIDFVPYFTLNKERFAVYYDMLVEEPEEFEVTATPDSEIYEKNGVIKVEVVTDGNAQDVSFYNEYGKNLCSWIDDVTANDDGSMTWIINTMIGTKGDRTITVKVNGEDAAEFNVKIVDYLPVESDKGIISAETANGTRVVRTNQIFNVIVQTGTEVVSVELANEYGNTFGKNLVSRIVNGDTVTWTYSICIGSKGNRTVTALGYDAYGQQVDNSASFRITVI